MGFDFPKFYNQPPFFTLQLHPETREQQVKVWGQLILDYAQYHKMQTIIISKALKSDLFANKAIDRKLDVATARVLLQGLINAGHADWESRDQDRCILYFQKPSDLARSIHRFITDTGQIGQVFTLYELSESDEMRKQDWHGCRVEVIRKALEHLEQEGRAELFSGSTPDSDGVKFLS